MNFRAFFPAMVAAVTLALPATGQAGRTYYTDRDHDGHYVKHHADWDHHHHGYYGGGYYGGYYGYPYRYGYGRPWGYSNYGYGYGYGPSIGLSFYSQPTYYSSRVYRGSVADNSLAVDVQRALRRQGYYYGSVDGIIGSGSRSAIRAYQRDRGLSITGRIDRELLRSLRIG
jgi:Putative peptidoglycan binding domain